MMPPKTGIIAGAGDLPRHLAQLCLETGRDPFVILLEGQAREADYAGFAGAVYRLGAAGAIIKRLRSEGVQAIVLAGPVKKPSLATLRPDFWSACFLLRTGVFSKGDDTLLQTLIRALEDEGFQVIGADDIAPELLMPEGCLTARTPNLDETRDIEVGIAAARALGARDAGQAVVAAGGAVIAEEDRRGTDAMLNDLQGEAHRGGVLVKTVKPDQERRADLPTIGVDTVTAVKSLGLAGIAVSAGDALLLQREQCIAAANAAGIFIVGIPLDTGAPP